MLISPLGDSAVVIRLGDGIDAAMTGRARALARNLEENPLPGLTDVVPAFASVAVFFQQPISDLPALEQDVAARVTRIESGETSVAPVRTLEIPVCYGGEWGPDLEAVARHTGLSGEQVVATHYGGDYLVHAIGFLPGFPYLGGLPATLATPRRSTPRPKVPAGSVGIGGAQTGVYPLASPGGWNLIGRTPLPLFDATRPEPALLQAGDRVRFVPISAEEFELRTAAEADRTKATPSPASAAAEDSAAEAAPNAMMIRRAGMLTTVQDSGRVGHRRQGVPVSGAADPLALRLANLLVGNVESAAGLEFTLVGPEIEFRTGALVAVGGGDFGVPCWHPFWVGAGETLRLGPARAGCRGYLAVAGGIAVPPILGSRSTYGRASLGGWGGRALQDGDILPVAQVVRRVVGRWRVDPRILPEYTSDPEVRVMGGTHTHEFQRDWAGESFDVTPQSDRMGLRLGGAALTRVSGGELTSMPVAPGTVQVPPDGHPIVLLADAQTVGGYPQLAHAVSVDLPLLAQLRPGDTVSFNVVPLREAAELWHARERALGMLREGLAQKLA